MKKTLTSLAGITWLANDILWYWGFLKLAFVVCCFTVIFMAMYFIDADRKRTPANFYIILILNAWVWMNTCSLIKDVFKVEGVGATVINVIVALLTGLHFVVLMKLFSDKSNFLSRLRKL